LTVNLVVERFHSMSNLCLPGTLTHKSCDGSSLFNRSFGKIHELGVDSCSSGEFGK